MSTAKTACEYRRRRGVGFCLALAAISSLLVVTATEAHGTWSPTTSNTTSSLGSATLLAPTGVGANTSGLLGGQINVTWTAPPTINQGTGTQVWQSAAGGGGTFTLDGTVSPGSATGYTASGLGILTRYCYYLITVDFNWSSPHSAQACATTLV